MNQNQNRYKGFGITLITVLVFLTATYIFNETQKPLYQTYSKIKLDVIHHSSTSRYSQPSFYEYQVRLKKTADKMLSEKSLTKLADNSQIKDIFKIEDSFDASRSATGTADIIKRLKQALTITIDPDDSTLSVNVSDQNAKLTSTVANLLPKQFTTSHPATDNEALNELKKIDNEIAHSVNQFKTTDQVGKDSITATKKTATDTSAEQNKIISDITEITNVLNGTRHTLSEAFSNKDLKQQSDFLIQKQIELQAVKQQPQATQTLQSEIGFARSRFSVSLQTELNKLKQQLYQLQTVQNNTTAALEEEKLFKEILTKDSFDPFFTDEKITIAQTAATPLTPHKPDKPLNLVMALVAGLCIGIIVSRTINWLSRKIKNEHDINNRIGLSVLGTINSK